MISLFKKSFSKILLKKDKTIATNTSNIGEALGTPKFHSTISNNQIKNTL